MSAKSAYQLYAEMQLHYRNYKLGGRNANAELGRVQSLAIQLMELDHRNPFAVNDDPNPGQEHSELYMRVTGRDKYGYK